MPKKKTKGGKNVIGAWAFLIGVVLAVLVGLVETWSPTQGNLAIALVVLGIVIGLLNIGGKELQSFLLAGTALVIVSSLGGSTLMGVQYLGSIMEALVVLFAPATIVVALKAVFAIAHK